MKLLFVTIFSLLVSQLVGKCVDQDTKRLCNNDRTGCGWENKMCKSCNMVTKENRCIVSHFCMWDDGKCKEKGNKPVNCLTRTSKDACVDEEGCKWKTKYDICVNRRGCSDIHKKKKCNKKKECEFIEGECEEIMALMRYDS